MMISPEAFINQFKNYPYEDLLKIRDEIMEDIIAFEEGNIDQGAYMIKPSPDTIYQMNLEYLAEMCRLIREKYSKKIWEEDEEEVEDKAVREEDNSVLGKLHRVQDILTKYQIESEIRYDRKEAPYINIGNVKSVSERVQFWCKNNSEIVNCWVGKHRSFWYGTAETSIYRREWLRNDREVYLQFNNFRQFEDFVRQVTHR